MGGATLAASGAVAGTLTPAAELARVNEAIGFFMGAGDVVFVPEDCAVAAVNANDAAFASVLELVVWDGATLAADGRPASPDDFVDLVVSDGDVETIHHLVVFETRSLVHVAAAGVIGVAVPSGGVVFGQGSPRLTPIYR